MYSRKGGLTKVKRCNPRRIGIQRLFPVGACFQKSAWRAVAAIRTTRYNSNGFDNEEIKGKHAAHQLTHVAGAQGKGIAVNYCAASDYLQMRDSERRWDR